MEHMGQCRAFLFVNFTPGSRSVSQMDSQQAGIVQGEQQPNFSFYFENHVQTVTSRV